MLLELQLALVVKNSIQDERCIPILAFDGRAVVRSVIVSNERIGLKCKVTELRAVGVLNHFLWKQESLAVAC